MVRYYDTDDPQWFKEVPGPQVGEVRIHLDSNVGEAFGMERPRSG